MFIMPTIPIFEIMEYVYIIIIFALFPLGLLYYVLPKKILPQNIATATINDTRSKSPNMLIVSIAAMCTIGFTILILMNIYGVNLNDSNNKKKKNKKSKYDGSKGRLCEKPQD